ncbi:MAG: metabolite traffic protein EboE [Myxococcota bacterium]
MQQGADGPHLTYCSNIHPGESWQETRAAVLRYVPQVRDRVAPGQRFGVGLRLSNEAVTTLLSGDALAEFAAALTEANLYVFTINGFPYGPFHGTPVKEKVYRPDWREPERELYTQRLIDAMERLLPDGLTGSISTVPGCFGERAVPGALERVAEALRRQAADLSYRARERGVTIALALEPEPACALETIADTTAFFRDHLLIAESIQRFAKLTALTPSDAELALRTHVGVCLDTCHAAVEFEDPVEAVQTLRREGITIAKAQLTTGIAVTDVTAPKVAALRPFADEVYLHQVVARGPEGVVRYIDLPDAFAAFEAGQTPTEEWRIHFHVPVFQRDLGLFGNTQAFLGTALSELLRTEATEHLEVETYTWDVLPPAHRHASVVDGIVGELAWVLSAAPHKR